MKKHSLVFTILIFPSWCFASLELPTMLDSIDLTATGSAAAGRVYDLGGGSDFHFGDSSDESNRTGDFHMNYSAEYAPTDPSDPVAPLKHSDNWAGGLGMNVTEKFGLGADYDALRDTFENLSSDGIKLSADYQLAKFSYRFARSKIASGPGTPKNFYGASIYQHTLELDYDYNWNDFNSFDFDAQYSFFTPNPSDFSNLLNLQFFNALNNFNDTLSSFTQWRVGGDWHRIWSDLIDSTAGMHVSHLIIPANPLVETSLGVGAQASRTFHVQFTWDYSHDPQSVQNLFTLDLRWTWDRGGVESSDKARLEDREDKEIPEP